MKYYTFSAVVFLCLFSLTFSSDQQAKIVDYPYFASIEVDGQYACSATIVDDFFVMTTNSCVNAVKLESLSVRGHRGVVLMAAEVVPYSGGMFGGSTMYDVALVKVAHHIPSTPKVSPVNPNNNYIDELQTGVLITWSSPKTRGSPLLSNPVYVMPTANCSSIYADTLNITQDMFCLWPDSDDSQPCQADLGAPFYYDEQYSGLVVHAPGCSDPSLPVVVNSVAQMSSFMIFSFCDFQSLFL